MRSHSCHRDPATPSVVRRGTEVWWQQLENIHPPLWPLVHSAIISIHYLQKLEGLISHGGDSLPLLDFTQTQRPGRINRINSLLETEADSSLKSAEYKLLEFFSFDINIQILWRNGNHQQQVGRSTWHKLSSVRSNTRHTSDTKTKTVQPSFCCLWLMWRKVGPGQPST